jgi:hypothetical protein
MSAFAESLSKFTPDATALDRDALLFAAGRASARPNRRWQAAAATLAACQLLTFVLLWSRPAPPGVPVVATSPTDTPAAIRPTERAGPASLWELRAQAVASEGALPVAAPVDDLVPPDPPLRAFAALPTALLQ